MAHHFGGVEGRMEVVSTEPLVIVDFAHTPDGMEKVLDSMKDKELIVVFGAGVIVIEQSDQKWVLLQDVLQNT